MTLNIIDYKTIKNRYSRSISNEFYLALLFVTYNKYKYKDSPFLFILYKYNLYS